MLQKFFYPSQLFIGVLFIGTLFFLKVQSKKSGFRVRESDLPRNPNPSNPAHRLANSKIKNPHTLLLSGFKTGGAPHEILGVAQNAKEPEILKAYRNMMKIYHPDQVGRPGTREWHDAQKIARAINEAKEALVKKLKNN